MGGGFGTTLTVIVAGVLWLVYLVPALRRNREYASTEKNTIRIQQALRTIALSTDTPDEIVTELSTREAAIRQRERDRLARQRDAAVRAEARAEYTAVDPIRARQHRSIKLGLTILVIIATVAFGFFGFAGQWTPAVVALAVVGLGTVSLVLVNAGRPVQGGTDRAQRFTGLPEVDDTWTPIRTPKVHVSMPEGAGLIVTEETIRKVEQADIAARIRQQAARVVAESEPAVDPRFGGLGPITEEVSAMDINAALRARRAQ